MEQVLHKRTCCSINYLKGGGNLRVSTTSLWTRRPGWRRRYQSKSAIIFRKWLWLSRHDQPISGAVRRLTWSIVVWRSSHDVHVQLTGARSGGMYFFLLVWLPLITRFKPFKDETRECSRRNYEINSVFTLGGYYYNGTSKQMKWRMLIWNITFGFYDLKKDERSGGLPTWRKELARPKRLRRYVASRE